MKQATIYSLYISISLYFLLTFLFGPLGQEQEKILSQYREDLNLNIQALEEQNQDLQNQIMLLKSSKEAVRLIARDMGYYQKDESVVVIKGLGTPSRDYNPGRLLSFQKIIPFSKVYFRLVSGTIFLMGIVFFGSLRRRGTSRKQTG